MVLILLELQPSGMSCELMIFFFLLPWGSQWGTVGGGGGGIWQRAFWLGMVHSCTSSEVWGSLFLTCLLPSTLNTGLARKASSCQLLWRNWFLQFPIIPVLLKKYVFPPWTDHVIQKWRVSCEPSLFFLYSLEVRAVVKTVTVGMYCSLSSLTSQLLGTASGDSWDQTESQVGTKWQREIIGL